MSKLLEQINKSSYQLRDLTSLISRGITPTYTEKDGVVILNQKCIRNWVVSYSESRLTKKEKINSGNKMLKEGDILICSTGVGTLGRVAQVNILNTPTTVDSHVSIVRPETEKVNPYFLGYILKKSEKLIESLAEGSTGQTELSRTKLQELEFELPARVIQNKVVDMMKNYDAKIENNNKIIKNLEATAQAIFNEWFVDFRFPGYEKAKFVESEMGEIPKEWNVGKIKDLIRVESGFPFSSGIFSDLGKYKLVTIRNVQDGSFVTDCDNLIAELPIKLPKHCLLHSGDILLSLTGNVGRICLVNGENYVLNQRVSVLIPVNERDRAYTYFLFRRSDFQNLLISISKGTAQLNLSPVETKELETIIPDDITLEKYSEIATPMYKKIVEINSENMNLKESRDQLLAKLI